MFMQTFAKAVAIIFEDSYTESDSEDTSDELERSRARNEALAYQQEKRADEKTN